MATATFTGKDQNWQDGTTVYWFEIDGEASGFEFNNTVYGVVESGSYFKIIDADGFLFSPREHECRTVARLVHVTDAMRALD